MADDEGDDNFIDIEDGDDEEEGDVILLNSKKYIF